MTTLNPLIQIQSQLKAPKGQTNAFGRYKYRSCEDILTAVKPHLAKHQCALTLSDDVVECGSFVFVKATAILSNDSGQVIAKSNGYAKHAPVKKGMDEAQITGSCSSYARKYALNGMFCIDDTQDADATNDHKTEATQKPKEAKDDKIKRLMKRDGVTGSELEAYLLSKGWLNTDQPWHTADAELIAKMADNWTVVKAKIKEMK